MIGRQNDPGGCAQLSSPDFLDRCRSQVVAWQAERARSTQQCALVTDVSIRETCQLRVAGLQIDAIVSAATLTSRIEDSDPRSQTLSSAPVEPDAAPQLQWRSLSDADGIELQAAPLVQPTRQGNQQFRRMQATELGITDPWDFRITDFFEPFIVGKGIASGDFNNDGWPDLVLAGDAGIAVYQNTGGHFAAAPVAQGELAGPQYLRSRLRRCEQ